jgi:hypothetical protein
VSAICKIVLPVSESAARAALEVFLRDRDLVFEVTQSEWPEAANRDHFNMGEDFPTVLSVKQVTNAITEIHFNSFAKVEELASFLSSQLMGNAVVNIYQSVSTASYWALHTQGQLARSIEAGDAAVSSHSGDRLPFEGVEPGREVTEDGDHFTVFDWQEQDWYNREVGVPVSVYQQYGAGWTNFVVPSEDVVSPPMNQRQTVVANLVNASLPSAA